MSKQQHLIQKTEVTKHSVQLTLENGVRVDVCANKGRIHLHFCGIGDSQITCSPLPHLGEDEKMQLTCSNEVNIFYKARSDD